MYDIIYQVYEKKFRSIFELNEFLQQFKNGELVPITISPVVHGARIIQVYFRTKNIWTKEQLLNLGLNKIPDAPI